MSKRLVSVLIAALVLAGCSGNVSERYVVNDGETCVGNQDASDDEDFFAIPEAQVEACAKAAVEQTPYGTRMVTIEFDDQGRFYDRAQFDRLRKILNSENVQTNGVSIVAFVHGWRHGAELNDSNFRLARGVLAGTAQVEHANLKPGQKAREVVGVYLRWRGLSASLQRGWSADPLEIFSFWDRKNTAERVATGQIREVLAYLSQYKKVRNELQAYKEEERQRITEIDLKDHTVAALKRKVDLLSQGKKGAASKVRIPSGAKPSADQVSVSESHPDVRLLIIGHSFGGLIVYESVADALMRSIVVVDGGEEDGCGVAEPGSAVADLVVVINSAVEAARYEPLHQAVMNRRVRPDCKGLGPVFLSITSTNDWATGNVFPAARWFSTVLEDVSPSSPGVDLSRQAKEENEAVNKALGHLDRYVTHTLSLMRRPKPLPDRQPDECVEQDKPDDFEKAAESQSRHYLRLDGNGDQANNPIRYFCVSKAADRRKVWDAEDNEIQSPRILVLNDDPRGELGKINPEPGMGTNRDSPVWVVRTDQSVVDGHNGLDAPQLRDFIVQLYHDQVLRQEAKGTPQPGG